MKATSVLALCALLSAVDAFLPPSALQRPTNQLYSSTLERPAEQTSSSKSDDETPLSPLTLWGTDIADPIDAQSRSKFHEFSKTIDKNDLGDIDELQW